MGVGGSFKIEVLEYEPLGWSGGVAVAAVRWQSDNAVNQCETSFLYGNWWSSGLAAGGV